MPPRPKADKEAMRRDRAAGDSLDIIAERYGVTRRYAARATAGTTGPEPLPLGGKDPGRDLVTSDLSARLWSDYVGGKGSYAELGAKYGLSTSTVFERIQTYVRNNEDQLDRTVIFRREVERLDHMYQELVDIVGAPAPPLYSQGRPVLDDDGNRYPDYSQKFQAISQILKANEATRRMHGLDAPDKLQVEAVQVHYELAGVSPEDLK